MKKKKSLILVLMVLLLVLLGLLAGWLVIRAQDPHDNRIVSGVSIAGVDVGGMTKGEAKKAIQAVASQYETEELVVTLPDAELRLTPGSTGATLDVAAAVKDAYRFGREWVIDAEELTVNLTAHLGLNTEYLRSVVDSYAAGFDGVYTETTYAIQGQTPELAEDQMDLNAAGQTLVVQMGTPGLALDMDQVYRDILDAYNSGSFTLDYGMESATATPEKLNAEALLAEFGIAAVNASLNEETHSAVPGAYGYGFDAEQVQKLLDEAPYGEEISFPMEYIQPEITQENVFFQNVLGYCETKHTDDEKRNTNLRLVCEILDGLILQPGEEFSFNDRVGERTKERGFQPAPAYSGDTLVNHYGGGVCQTSSTLYNCALLADLEITDRRSHGYVVRYLPIGLDATVNWGTTDFCFRNNRNYPIMLKGEVSDGLVKMWILGVDDLDYYIVMEDYHSTGGGYTYASTYRCKYDKETDEQISRELEARSIYRSYDTKRTC